MKTILLLCCLAALAMGKLPSQWRQCFVDWHNEFRRSQGAANMCRMHWSDSLAQQADEWISNCEFNGYYGNGMNFAYYTGENNMDNIRKLFQEWADERDEYDFSGNGCGNSCRYTQMVWYNTREIGCSVRRCPIFSVYDTVYENAWYMACSYASRENMYNDFYNSGEMSMNNNMNGYQFFYPFIKGQACQFCNECEDGLCVGEYNSDFNGMSNWNNNGFSNWNNWYNQNNDHGYWNFKKIRNKFRNNRCQDLLPYCQNNWVDGICEFYEYDMRTLCPRTCGFCAGHMEK